MGLQIMNYECPSCGAVKCREHCNNCGISIHGKVDPYDDKWKWYEAGTEIEHRCMQNGTRTGRWLHVNDTLPNEYQLNAKVMIVRCGNSPVFKCLYCGQRGDLPIMKEHHKEGKCLIKQKQEEWKETEKEPNIIDLKNQRIDSFIQKVMDVGFI